MYWLTAPTACAMSGLVHIIANIKLLTADAYSTWDISFFYASLLGHILEDNLKLTGSGVEIDLQSCMLNRARFSSSSSSEKAKSSCYFCRWICIPKILFASPKSFISNSLANCAFNSWIRSLLGPATNISSTYNNKIMKSLSSTLL